MSPLAPSRRRAIAPTLALTAALALAAALAPPARAQEEAQAPSVREEMARHAEELRAFVRSEIANAFLDAVTDLPEPMDMPRTVYYNKETRAALLPKEAEGLGDAQLEDFEKLDLDEQFYYYGNGGTPLAFVRLLDLMGRAGLESLDGARVMDFGFGTVGQLRLMAECGADAHGLEVSELLEKMYTHPGDTGRVTRAKAAGVGEPGRVTLHFGQWPAREDLVQAVGGGYDAFISKNTLKNGYIHPAEEVDPRMLVHLGVDDETYVRQVYNALEDGGWFMIYNLCPAPREDRYIPWSDGRCPFSRKLLEETGFTVLAYNEDDTKAAREMGKMLGWGENMDLEHDLFGTYTLMRK